MLGVVRSCIYRKPKGTFNNAINRRLFAHRFYSSNKLAVNLEKVVPNSGSKRVFSGIQPTGIPHLGNYCGALSKWVQLQNDSTLYPIHSSEYIYCVVDLHAMTVPYDASLLQKRIRSMVASFLGAGLSPNNCIIFKQSDVIFHSELQWLFSCITPLSWLHRMTQFKDKRKKQELSNIESSLGLLTYPVLMAADILLYNATHVPAGDDQKQHIEFTRALADRFNHRYNCKIFTPPSITDLESGLHRLMSLKDPKSKMSKSDPAKSSRILLTDTSDNIYKKIKKAQTDSINGIYFDQNTRPGISNLLTIMSEMTDTSIPKVVEHYSSYTTGEFKKCVAEAVIARICPIGDRIQQFEKDPGYIDQILEEGSHRANGIAEKNMRDIRRAMGLSSSTM